MKTWLDAALKQENPAARGSRSDFDLNNEADQAELESETLRAAAVLVPIVMHDEGPTVLLTKRTENLSKHAGQVSFPGGSIDPEDEDDVAAALREASEEIGLLPEQVQIHGRLDMYRTGTGFEISPIVATIEPGFELIIAEDEVAEAFEVPLDFFLDRSNHQQQSAVWRGRRRHYYAMPYGDYFIWGATAAMLVNLIDILESVRESA
ncbi:CoA pyrophosphatase [Kordiimonas aquimaris]|uniref:CoA pyrophosphatase n=1 Tax=Kordiimonas aquimaris TaxID=707591 RepID=UPI0021D3BF3A|nr:CoA pyrophosphatase [Kordiimonas aquimaris]